MPGSENEGRDGEGTLKRKECERQLARLHAELVKLQRWVVHKSLKICIIFEGRDGAGKGGTIKAITERVSPRVITVRRGREVVGFEQDEAGIGIVHAASAGLRYGEGSQGAAPPRQTETVRARWLVGCDGGRSFVRTQLGIKMVGKSFPEPWLVVDIKAKEGEDCFRHLPYFNFYCDPRNSRRLLPAASRPSPLRVQADPGQTKEYMEDPATVRMFLGRHIDVEKIEILRRRVYTFNALMAERWLDGRILLAGDAAHMTPQFMGQGMSSGVRDAYNLAWKLDAVLRGQASERLIDSYESERKPHAQEMIDVSVRMKKFVSQSHPAKAALRNLIVRTMLMTPKLGDYIREVRFKPPPTYPKGSYLGLPRKGRKGAEGRPIPQPSVRSFDGRRMLLDDVLGEGFALMGLAPIPARRLIPTVMPRWRLSARASSRSIHSAGGRRDTTWRARSHWASSKWKTSPAKASPGCARRARAQDMSLSYGPTSSCMRWCPAATSPWPRNIYCGRWTARPPRDSKHGNAKSCDRWSTLSSNSRQCRCLI